MELVGGGAAFGGGVGDCVKALAAAAPWLAALTCGFLIKLVNTLPIARVRAAAAAYAFCVAAASTFAAGATTVIAVPTVGSPNANPTCAALYESV